MKWEYKEIEERDICERKQVSKLVGKLLAASSLTEEQIDVLLDPTIQMEISHASCIQQCVKRLLLAKERGEKVFIGGDYDADGICATAILKDTLDRLGIENGYYIPDRFKEGYGLSAKTVEMVVEKGYGLIITVDNGVKAFEAIARAKELGIDLIVTDHHQIDKEVPVDILVHPDYMEDCFSYYSGAGVAQQISTNVFGFVDEHIALAAIAAIGDVMQLWKQTRHLVKKGLQLLNEGCLPSIQAMIHHADTIDEITIGFQIVPKLNSVGRMNDISNVNTIVPFLLSKDSNDIAYYAMQLEQVNERRKQLSRTMSELALSKVTEESFLVLADEKFHEGVCGLVAGRVVEETGKPTLIFAKKDGLYKGSGRSIPGFDLFGFFSEGFPELVSFGGHEQAIGLSLKEEDFLQFESKINEKMKQMEFMRPEKTKVAIQIPVSDITIQNIQDLKLLSPYPKEMVEPLFCIQKPEIRDLYSSEKITKYTLQNGVQAIAFAFRDLPVIPQPSLMIGSLSINAFRGNQIPQIDILAIEE